METLQCLEASDLKDLLLPLGARTKLLHALKRNPGWRPRLLGSSNNKLA